MNTRPVPWQQRTPALLLAGLLQALFIVAFLRALALRASPIVVPPLQVHIVTQAPSPQPLPPPLYAPPLAAAHVPSLVAPVVLLPSVVSTPAASTGKVALRPTAVIKSSAGGETPPQFIAGPLDADTLYPMAARMTFTEGRVWTQVCVYSTGKIASVALIGSSGDSGLDQAALTIARETQWKPAMVDGKPVARCSHFQIDFSLFH